MNYSDHRNAKKPSLVDQRIQMVLIFCMAIFSVLVFRLWTIQIFQHETYAKRAESNHNRILPVLSERGKILDRHGRILAEDVNFWDVWMAVPTMGRRVVTDEIRHTLTILSGILEEEYDVLENRYLTRDRDTVNKQLRVRVANQIRFSQYVSIQQRLIEFAPTAMVYTKEVPTRRYRYGESAAHILGSMGEITARQLSDPRFVGYKSGDRIGRSGIEQQYEHLLRGKDGQKKVIVDRFEIQQGVAIETVKAIPGNNVVLNLDIDLQLAAEDILGVSSGVIIAQDPRDGAILAMATNPRYDPNRYADYLHAPNDPLYHKAIRGTYPPGSVWKIFEIIPLLEELKISPRDTVFCSGGANLYNRTWRCHRRGGHGHVNMFDAICVSCNVYFYQNVGMRLKEDRLLTMAAELGFTAKTGIDLPEETHADYPTRQTVGNWYPGDTINLSIGQGHLRLTPIQITNAVSAIANKGTLFQPRLGKMGIDSDGNIIEVFEPVAMGRVSASTKTWETVHQAMWEVVNNPQRGTGRRVAEGLHVQVAGKTGTAQTSDSQGRTHAWFVAYAPHDEPEIVVTVLAELAGGGGAEASPLARDLLQVYFGRQEIVSRPTGDSRSG